MKWSKEDIKRLRYLYEQGKSDEYIAEILGTTPITVKNKIQKLSISNLDTKETEKRINEMQKPGETEQRIINRIYKTTIKIK